MKQSAVAAEQRKSSSRSNIETTGDGVFRNMPPRIIVIGDLHGCYESTISAFKLAGVICLHGKRWVYDTKNGANTYVVQVGDQVDRKGREAKCSDEDSEERIIKFVDYLDNQAKACKSRVLSLLGNHCLQNVQGDFSYASPKGLEHYGGPQGRLEAYRPGGRLATYFAQNRYVVIKLGCICFVHGGVLPHIAAKYKISQINQIMRHYLLGKSIPKETIHELFDDGDNSLLWNRSYSGTQRPQCNEQLQKVFQLWGCKIMCVGHTPQNTINHACDKKVWRVDVGMSKAFGSGPVQDRVQVLEITPGEPHTGNAKVDKKPTALKFRVLRHEPKK